MLTPSDLETAVVDHQALKVAQSVERCSRGGIDERNKADVLVRDVPNMVKQTTAHDIADFFNGRLRMDVSQVYGSVAQVVDASSRSRYRCGGN